METVQNQINTMETVQNQINTINIVTDTYIDIPDNYELKYKNGKCLIKKQPDYQENSVVHLNGDYYGYIIKYNNEHAQVVVYTRFSDNWMFGAASNVVAEELRPATPEEEIRFYDIIHAFGYDIENNRCVDYKPELKNCNYSIGIENGDFVVWNNINGIRPQMTKQAAEICRDILSYHNKKNTKIR